MVPVSERRPHAAPPGTCTWKGLPNAPGTAIFINRLERVADLIAPLLAPLNHLRSRWKKPENGHTLERVRVLLITSYPPGKKAHTFIISPPYAGQYAAIDRAFV